MRSQEENKKTKYGEGNGNLGTTPTRNTSFAGGDQKEEEEKKKKSSNKTKSKFPMCTSEYRTTIITEKTGSCRDDRDESDRRLAASVLFQIRWSRCVPKKRNNTHEMSPIRGI